MGICSFPITEAILCYFVTAEANRRISYGTIKVYLFGVLHQNILLGYHHTLAHFPILFRTLRGIRRVQGNSLRKKPRTPITVQHMTIIITFIQTSNMPFVDKLMYMAAIHTAFYGLLRVSEYTSPTQTRYDSTLHLLQSDISFNLQRTIMFLRLKGSKTDPFRIGTVIRISAIPTLFCPVRAMLAYFRSLPIADLPLFRFSDGRLLTRRHINKLLKNALPNIHDISSHSFRIGGASAALSAGASDALIKILGRWSSDCYIRYLRVSDDLIEKFQRAMAKVTSTTSVWDPCDKILK
ncbi:uncharacterized protein [Clytia hemisphaerica]|uniref:uncharacterized protein n=1 Tax=Clytia hemisphaerica TaxID=252671 RepID=UPI0034D691D1